MTENEAKLWIEQRFGEEQFELLVEFAEMVAMESARQNLVSASSLSMIWSRHIVDSAQLVPLSTKAQNRLWVDVGTGAGFPGIVTGILSNIPTILVEPRRRRIEFLNEVIDRLGLSETISVVGNKVETVKSKAAIISARAVAPVATLFETAAHISHLDTLWILPKGRSAPEEVAEAKRSWHGTFHVEQSITDPTSLIVMASRIARR